ncbi:hypothetical protein LTR05_003568 [Lithohypha guttulata]|uniref:Uncharacterized protein n=1 Tax=Lithohypha guttulata TaxID=1690604 RepID=A0AAN7YB70_9EURO|nr:hypothetical protein LTR05_003568 [Lithohypha guttulata]
MDEDNRHLSSALYPTDNREPSQVLELNGSSHADTDNSDVPTEQHKLRIIVLTPRPQLLAEHYRRLALSQETMQEQKQLHSEDFDRLIWDLLPSSFPSTPSPLARRLDLSRKRNTTAYKSFLIHHNGFELKTSNFMFTYEDNIHLKPFSLNDQGDFTESLRSCERDGGKASAM